MSAKFAHKFTLILCVMLMLSTLAVSSAVSAQQNTPENAILAVPPDQSIQGGSPVPGGPGFISVSTFGFKPQDPTMDLSYSTTRMFNDGVTSGLYFAPVNLPDGASLTHVLFFYYDTVVADNMHFYLLRVNMFDGSTEQVARVFADSSTGYAYVESAIFRPTVDNQLYSYILEVGIPSGFDKELSLINVRIDYSYPVFLPTVQK